MSKKMEAVWNFWFGELDEEGCAEEELAKAWFTKNPDFDREIRENFEELYEEVVAGEHEDWLETERGLLTYVVVLDQFSRNMFRDTAKMYAADPQALAAAKMGIERGDDKKLPFAARKFLYMPLMHSEELADQRRCKELFENWRDELEGEKKEEIQVNVGYADRHLVIVERFGRFPHRNWILGRESTPEEVEFLKTPGSSF